MALAQFCLSDSRYFGFYERAAQRGEKVILDNGAYEKAQVEWDQLIHLVLEMKPSVVVLPDLPGNWAETWRMGVEFEQQLRASKRSLEKWEVGVKPCMILHADDGDLWQFIEGYRQITRLFPWVGFSRLTNSYGSPRETTLNRRVKFAEGLQKIGLWSRKTTHHAFGMLKGAVEELPLLDKVGFFGCDSSAPVWRGLHGHKIQNRGWLNVPFSSQIWDVKMEHIWLADLNLRKVLAKCK